MHTNNREANIEKLERLEKSLFQLTHVIQKHQEIVQRRFSVSSVEIEILKLIGDEGDKKMRDIGDRVNVKLSNLTNIIDRLESNKQVKRINSKTDRRSIFVHITSKGKKLIGDYNEYLRELSSRMQASLMDDQFNVLVDGLEKILDVTVVGEN